MKQYLFPVFLGVLGAGILISLGVWQLQRLEWKERVLAEIDAKIAAAPGPVPLAPAPETHRYAPVQGAGAFDGEEVHVLISVKGVGPGYRVIQAFETGQRRILVDRGFIPTTEKGAGGALGPARVIGNLHWPDEIDRFTPDPDIAANIWFARDVPALSAALDTEPVLVVARQIEGAERATPLPVTTAGIPNDHLEYAVTWFGLAAVWLGMTAFLLWRIYGRTNEGDG
ncbi:MAG: SURF1 family protein [Pseudomonadota bacterium]